MQNLLDQSEKTVVSLYETLTRPEFLYHNLVHTREVVEGVQLMRDHYQLPEQEDLAVADSRLVA